MSDELHGDGFRPVVSSCSFLVQKERAGRLTVRTAQPPRLGLFLIVLVSSDGGTQMNA